MKKSLVCLMLWMSLIPIVVGQIPQPLQTVPSPNAWSFTQYGKVPVSGFTGLPTISIPLHNLVYKDQQLSTTLSYNASGFRPDIHASWVGTGWNLNLGGVVTRQVNGLPDEFSYTLNNICKCHSQLNNNASETFNLGFKTATQNTDYSLSNLLTATNHFVNSTYSFSGGLGAPTWISYPYPVPFRGNYWGDYCWFTNKFWRGQYIDTTSTIDNIYLGTKDLQSDEYSFNVMGYSGKFYFINPTGIEVISDKKFVVSAMGTQDIPNELWKPVSSSQAGANCSNWITGFSPWKAMNVYPKALRGFSIQAEDKTTFIFGNDEYWKDAVEYSISEYLGPGQTSSGAQTPQDYWVANAWHLTTVILPDGRTIDYEYQRGEYTRTLFNSEFSFGVTQNNPNCWAANASYDASLTVNSKVTSPVYLKRIVGELFEANLSWSNTDEVNRLKDVAGSPFKWKKLDEIQFKDYEGNQFKWKFSYYPLSSRGQRLFLKEAERFTIDNASLKEKYSLLYDTSLALPDYNMSQNDHWGFWNGVNSGTAMGNSNETMDALRSPILAKTQAGILKRIVFPTGGYNDFTYEQNSYSKRVKMQRDLGTESLGMNKNAGGLRIKSVIAYDPIADKTATTEYYYADGYSPSLTPAQISQLPSSGVLNQYSFVYHWDQIVANMYTYQTCLQDVKLKVTSNQPMNPALDDYHIGYSTVIEKYGDGSYKKLTFTNHDNGYPDDPAIDGINTFESPFNKFSSRAMERGKLKKEDSYSSANRLLSSTETEFSAIAFNGATDPKTYITRFTFVSLDATAQSASNNPLNIVPLSYILSNRFKEYTYSFQPTKIVSKTWDQLTNNYLTSTKTIQYSYNWPSVIIDSTSDGRVKKETNKYYWNFTGGGFMMTRMAEYPGTIIEKIHTIKNDSVSEEKVTAAVLNEYYQNPYSAYSRPLPKNSYSLAINAPIPVSNFTTTVAKDLTFSSSDTWNKDSRYVRENETTTFDRFHNPLNSSRRDSLQQGVFKGFNDLRVIASVRSTRGNFWHMAATSFENQSVSKVVDGSGTTVVIPDSDQWILEGTKNSTDPFTGSFSFVGRVRFKDYTIKGSWFVTAKSSGAAPTLERYTSTTNTYDPTNVVPTVVMQSPGWKTYRFDYSNAGVMLAINSNGNVIDDVILGPYSTSPQYYTIYSYNSGRLSTITNEKHQKTFFEYDAIGRLKVVRDQDGKVVKVYDYHFQAPSFADAVWEITGTTRCKPCPQNEAYITGVQQREEKDTNPQSTTYNQTRWVDTGSSPNCVAIADWQNTNTAVRCRKTSGYNTGEREQEQMDKNPCSSTFNTLRWAVTDTNLTSCPLPPLHPVLSFSNGYLDGTTSYADLVIDIYADANHTVPLSAYNLTINYVIEKRNGSGTLLGTTNASVVCNGKKAVVGSVPLITYGRNGTSIILQNTYSLTSGAGYVIP